MAEKLAAIKLVQADDIAGQVHAVIALNQVNRLRHAQEPNIIYRELQRPRQLHASVFVQRAGLVALLARIRFEDMGGG